MKSNILTNWFYTMNQIVHKDSDIKPTHLLLDGGRVKIDDTLIDNFYKLYAKCYDDHIPLHIVEHKTKLYKFFSDLDFVNKIEMTTDELIKIVNVIQQAVYHIFETNHDVIICTTDNKIIIKNDNKYIKQGVHLYWPTIIVNNENAILIRRLIVHKLKSIFGERDEINIWEDVVDLSVYKSNGIRMIGSSKCSYDRSEGKVNFIDDKRIYLPTLIINSFKNIEHDKLKELLKNSYKMIVETSIRIINGELSELKNYPEKLKTDNKICEDCDEEETVVSKKLNSTSNIYQEIVRFFRIHVKNYSADDIKKILNFDDKVYIILTKSKYCQNIGRPHASCQIYFKLTKEGLTQKCHCTCNTMLGRKYGYCHEFASQPIQCTEHLLRFLKWNIKTKDNFKIDLPNIAQLTISSSKVITYREQLYNQFTNKSPPKQRKTFK